MATAQLQLTSFDADWKLDRRTIEIGRAGVARARQALAQAGPALGEGPSGEASDSTAGSGSDRYRNDPTGSNPSRARRPRVSDGQGSLALFADSRFIAA